MKEKKQEMQPLWAVWNIKISISHSKPSFVRQLPLLRLSSMSQGILLLQRHDRLYLNLIRKWKRGEDSYSSESRHFDLSTSVQRPLGSRTSPWSNGISWDMNPSNASHNRATTRHWRAERIHCHASCALTFLSILFFSFSVECKYVMKIEGMWRHVSLLALVTTTYRCNIPTDSHRFCWLTHDKTNVMLHRTNQKHIELHAEDVMTFHIIFHVLLCARARGRSHFASRTRS